jgi:hypothetical protein
MDEVSIENRFLFDLQGFLLLRGVLSKTECSAHYNVVMREPRNAHHFYFPPEIRARFDQNQQDLTKWMEFTKWDY